MDFTTSEIVAIKRALEPEVKEDIKVGRPKKGAESAQLSKGKSRDIVAKFTGKSHDTLEKAEKIVKLNTVKESMTTEPPVNNFVQFIL